MATFSLINISFRDESLVSGNWIQNVIGSLEEAIERAKSTEKANGNKIEVAVVDEIMSSNPILHGMFFKQLNLRPVVSGDIDEVSKHGSVNVILNYFGTYHGFNDLEAANTFAEVL